MLGCLSVRLSAPEDGRRRGVEAGLGSERQLPISMTTRMHPHTPACPPSHPHHFAASCRAALLPLLLRRS